MKARIEKGLLKELDPLTIIAAASTINLLNGPLDWYYIYVVPFLYMISMKYILLHRRGKYVGTVMVLIQVMQSILFFSGAIPYAREIPV